MGKRRSSRNLRKGLPDFDDQDEIHDEIDQFHLSRDKIHLDESSGIPGAPTDEEILSVNAESDSEDDEDDSAVSSSDSENKVDMASDIEDDDETYLPSASAWGKKKSTYYSTDYVDQDRAELSESEEDEAKLEEQEALRLQKQLLDGTTAEDYALDMFDDTEKLPSTEAVEPTAVERVELDVSKLTKKEQIKMLKKQSPEFFQLLKEFKEKLIEIDQMKPLLTLFEQHPAAFDNSGLNFLRIRLEAISCYLLNLNFYFFLRASQTSSVDHPVFDRIMQWKKILIKLDKRYKPLERQVAQLLEKLNAGEDVSPLLVKDVLPGSSERKSKKGAKSEPTSVEDSMELMEDEAMGESEDEEGKRGITYQMAKNKGLMPKRKKEQRNPRVKHREKFRKAKIKRRSQIADVKRELVKYGGESRGIRAGVVRSIKLQ